LPEGIENVVERDKALKGEADGGFVDDVDEAQRPALIAGQANRLARPEQRALTAVHRDKNAVVSRHRRRSRSFVRRTK